MNTYLHTRSPHESLPLGSAKGGQPSPRKQGEAAGKAGEAWRGPRVAKPVDSEQRAEDRQVGQTFQRNLHVQRDDCGGRKTVGEAWWPQRQPEYRQRQQQLPIVMVDAHRREELQEGDTGAGDQQRSEEHTSELQSLMHISYAVFCLKKK